MYTLINSLMYTLINSLMYTLINSLMFTLINSLMYTHAHSCALVFTDVHSHSLMYTTLQDDMAETSYHFFFSGPTRFESTSSAKSFLLHHIIDVDISNT